MQFREELRVEAIRNGEAVLGRTNYKKIEYPLGWIPFSIKVNDVLVGTVCECRAGVVSRIDFEGFED